MLKYAIDTVQPIGKKSSKNPCIVDTAGFEPFDVKLKRLILNGMVNRLRQEQFDSSDYKMMLETIPLKVNFDDDLIDVKAKMQKIQEIKNQILLSKQKAKVDLTTSTHEPASESNAQQAIVDPVDKSINSTDVE